MKHVKTNKTKYTRRIRHRDREYLGGSSFEQKVLPLNFAHLHHTVAHCVEN